MPEKSKRRCFQFSLMTLFVVMTLVALWLGWQASIVRERQAVLAEKYDERYSWWPQDDKRAWWSVRQLMGDRTYGVIVIPEEAPADRIARIKRVFPEAEVLALDIPFRATGPGDAALSKAIADFDAALSKAIADFDDATSTDE